MENTWRYRNEISNERDIVGYEVEASDGHIGKVDEASQETVSDSNHLVVDTGFWIFGKKRLVPAGVVIRVDHDSKTVFLNMTKDQVKDAPDWHERWHDDVDRDTHGHDHVASRDTYGTYYSPFGW